MTRQTTRRAAIGAMAIAAIPPAATAGWVDWTNGVPLGTALPAFDAEHLVAAPRADARFTLIDFWATWCAPCREEIPRLNALYGRFRQRGLELIGLSLEPRSLAERFVARVSMDYPCGAGGRQPLQKTLGIRALPYTIGVDATRTIVWRGQPDEIDDAKLESWLERRG